MNAQKLLVGTLAGAAFLFLLDYLLYGVLLTDTFTRFPGYHREMPVWLWIILGLIILMGCFTYIYLKGVEPLGTKMQQGLRYGVVFGIMLGFGVGLIYYSLQIPTPLNDYLIDGVIAIVRFGLAGIVVAYATGVPGTDRGKGPGGE